MRNNTIRNYTLIGILFGLAFPIGALVFESIRLKMSLNIDSIVSMHKLNPLLFMVDSAPLFLGVFASLGGVSKSKADDLNIELNLQLEALELTKRQCEDLATSSENQYDKIHKTATQLTNNYHHTEVALSSLEKLSSTIEDLSHTITDHVQDIADTVTSSSEYTNTLIKEVDSACYEIASSVNMVENKFSLLSSIESEVLKDLNHFDSLDKNVNTITELITTITSIADDISLLSLNASIEAARAGESGRGFEIVAKEVGRLAIFTKDTVSTATQSIDALLTSTKQLSSDFDDIRSNLGSLSTVHETIVDVTETINQTKSTLINLTIEASQMIENQQSSIQVNKDSIDDKIKMLSKIEAISSSIKVSLEQLSKDIKSLDD